MKTKTSYNDIKIEKGQAANLLDAATEGAGSAVHLVRPENFSEIIFCNRFLSFQGLEHCRKPGGHSGLHCVPQWDPPVVWRTDWSRGADV